MLNRTSCHETDSRFCDNVLYLPCTSSETLALTDMDVCLENGQGGWPYRPFRNGCGRRGLEREPGVLSSVELEDPLIGLQLHANPPSRRSMPRTIFCQSRNAAERLEDQHGATWQGSRDGKAIVHSNRKLHPCGLYAYLIHLTTSSMQTKLHACT